MSYFKKPLGDVWWGTGTSGGQQTTAPSQPQQPSSYGTPATTPPPQPPTQKKEEGVGSELAKIFGALVASKIATPPSQGPYVVQQPRPGISPTMLIGGGLALTAIILLMKD